MIFFHKSYHNYVYQSYYYRVGKSIEKKDIASPYRRLSHPHADAGVERDGRRVRRELQYVLFFIGHRTDVRN